MDDRSEDGGKIFERSNVCRFWNRRALQYARAKICTVPCKNELAPVSVFIMHTTLTCFTLYQRKVAFSS